MVVKWNNYVRAKQQIHEDLENTLNNCRHLYEHAGMNFTYQIGKFLLLLVSSYYCW